jgi:Lipocalin-like domain
MTAYTGRFRVEGDKLITTVDGAWNEVFKAHDQVRIFKLEGDALTIHVPEQPSGLEPGKRITVSSHSCASGSDYWKGAQIKRKPVPSLSQKWSDSSRSRDSRYCSRMSALRRFTTFNRSPRRSAKGRTRAFAIRFRVETLQARSRIATPVFVLRQLS